MEAMETREMSYKTYGNLGIITLDGCKEMGERIDKLIHERRANNIDFLHGDGQQSDTFILPTEHIRFSNGEGKSRLLDTARGKDLYIICDVGNYSCTYQMYGYTNHKSPDDHLQDIRRVLSAIDGKSRRTTVIMPLLYASRQDKRKTRESLDCALALQDLERMGVTSILTFDVHNTAIQNAIPLVSFENLYATYDILNALFVDEPDVFNERDNLLIISPDTGGMDRAIYYSSMMNVDVGLFYKRRDYKTIVRGMNPIIAHEYMGRDVEGENVLIVDDMISSGESVFDIILELKKRKAAKIFIAMTFSLFTQGIDKFQEFYEEGRFDRLYSTNLTYIPDSVKNAKWFREVDMSDFLARMIDSLNYDLSLAPLLDATPGIKQLLKEKL